MQAMNEMQIRITEDELIEVSNTENGVTSFKHMRPETFLQCVQSSVKLGNFNSGLLPQGCISFSTDDKERCYICIDFGCDRCDITYEKTDYPYFPLPRLIFGFYMREKRIISVKLGVTEQGRLTPRSKMYVYPFSNVNGFGLCLGANSLPGVKSLHQLEGIMHYIMSMPNNNDRYSADNTCLELEYRELLETLKDKTPEFYYSDVLRENGKTLTDFING